mgnify:CR=1 FL=1
MRNHKTISPFGQRGRLLARIVYIAVFFLFAALSLPAASEEVSLLIASASDLSFALKEISGQFENRTGIKAVISFGSTGNLAHQIENNAPFDLFFSADVKHIERLEAKGLILPETKTLYASGRLVLAANKKNAIDVRSLEDLLKPEVKNIAIANPEHAPYGLAAKEALTKAGVWEKVKHKLVYAENIRTALKYIQTGDAEAGIIALSIADVPEAAYTPIDEGLHSPITQAAAVVKNSAHKNEAAAFIRYVSGPEGWEILKKYGFTRNVSIPK